MIIIIKIIVNTIIILGATLVDNAIDEDLPIRQICKDAFLGPLNTLSSTSTVSNLQVRLKSLH
jgi:hypothetical protein